MKKITDYAELVKAKHALNKTIAPVEDGASMAGSYTSGKQFIRDSVLYSALTSIAAGTAWSSLTLDTDYEVADDVSTQIAAVNQTLTQEVTAMVNVYGSKNLLPNNLVTQTKNGITFTHNADGSITVSGTNSEANQFEVDLVSEVSLPSGDYILSGCPSSGGYSSYWIYCQNITDTQNIGDDTGSGIELTINSAKKYRFSIFIAGSAVISTAVTFKPMLRDARIVDSTYEPYAMTNQQLTPYAQAQSNPNLLDNPFFTVNQRGQSSYSGGGTAGAKYTLDRWRIEAYSNLDVSVNNDGSITLINPSANENQQLVQVVENSIIENGKTYTLSLDVVEYTNIVKFNLSGISSPYPSIIPSTIVNQTGINSVTGTKGSETNTWKVAIMLGANASVTLRAVKLELGSVSTLAQDTAPNYQQELAKCQRYFINAIGNGASGYFNDADAILSVPVPVQMRAVPTVTLNYANNIIDATGNVIAVPANAAVTATQNQHNAVRITVPTSRTATGILPCVNADTSFNFSADL